MSYPQDWVRGESSYPALCVRPLTCSSGGAVELRFRAASAHRHGRRAIRSAGTTWKDGPVMSDATEPTEQGDDSGNQHVEGSTLHAQGARGNAHGDEHHAG
jgi:hypothetical protein